ncbi:MAG: hypothetical protein ABIU54_14095 [Candidatus Eisenbacteria bacterium]
MRSSLGASRGAGLAVGVMAFLLVGPAMRAASAPNDPHEQAHLQASVSPSRLKLGERATYRGRVVLPQGIGVHFAPPVAGGAFSWGTPVVRRGPITDPKSLDFGKDSVVVMIPIQVFETGPVPVPGLRLRLDRLAPRLRPLEGRLPVVQLVVTPVLTPADSAAQLRPVRGPLLAPWWERIAWSRVIAALVIVAVVVALIVMWRRRRRPALLAKPAPAAPRVRRDPAQVALAALAALRAERLPDRGLYGEHALHLTRILRVYLEATLATPRPGDTSAELLERLASAQLSPAEVLRLEGLLGFWDRVKFARAPMGTDEAVRCEDAVEALLRRGERPREVA